MIFRKLLVCCIITTSILHSNPQIFLDAAQTLQSASTTKQQEAWWKLKQLAAMSDRNAIDFVGRCYYHGHYVEKDITKACQYFKNLLAIPGRGKHTDETGVYDDHLLIPDVLALVDVLNCLSTTSDHGITYPLAITGAWPEDAELHIRVANASHTAGEPVTPGFFAELAEIMLEDSEKIVGTEYKDTYIYLARQSAKQYAQNLSEQKQYAGAAEAFRRVYTLGDTSDDVLLSLADAEFYAENPHAAAQIWMHELEWMELATSTKTQKNSKNRGKKNKTRSETSPEYNPTIAELQFRIAHAYRYGQDSDSEALDRICTLLNRQPKKVSPEEQLEYYKKAADGGHIKAMLACTIYRVDDKKYERMILAQTDDSESVRDAQGRIYLSLAQRNAEHRYTRTLIKQLRQNKRNSIHEWEVNTSIPYNCIANEPLYKKALEFGNFTALASRAEEWLSPHQKLTDENQRRAKQAMVDLNAMIMSLAYSEMVIPSFKQTFILDKMLLCRTFILQARALLHHENKWTEARDILMRAVKVGSSTLTGSSTTADSAYNKVYDQLRGIAAVAAFTAATLCSTHNRPVAAIALYRATGNNEAAQKEKCLSGLTYRAIQRIGEIYQQCGNLSEALECFSIIAQLPLIMRTDDDLMTQEIAQKKCTGLCAAIDAEQKLKKDVSYLDEYYQQLPIHELLAALQKHSDPTSRSLFRPAAAYLMAQYWIKQAAIAEQTNQPLGTIQLQRAKILLQEASKRRHPLSRILYACALLHNKPDEARQLLEEADILENVPRLPLYFLLADINKQLGDKSESYRFLDMSADRKYIPAMIKMSKYWHKKGNYIRAHRYLREIVDMVSDNHPVIHRYGMKSRLCHTALGLPYNAFGPGIMGLLPYQDAMPLLLKNLQYNIDRGETSAGIPLHNLVGCTADMHAFTKQQCMPDNDAL